MWGDGGDSNGSGVGGAGGAAASGGGGELEPYSVTFDPVTVEPGRENTRCIIKQLDNPTAIRVGKIHNELGPGSHHLIVYTTSDAEERTEPFECQPFFDLLDPTKGAPLMITQKQDDVLELPDGVAFALGEKQMIRLEMHYINPSSEPLEVHAKTTFYAMPEAEVEHEANFLFVGNPDIDIQPHSKATLGPTFSPAPGELEGVKYFGFTGHQHRWGTGVTVAAAADENDAGQVVYDPPDFAWSEPPTVYHDPPIELPEAGGFRFTCTWQNDSSEPVEFGESANDEMCFFWTYYYPSKGAFVCAHTDRALGGIDLCCPGHPLCDQLF